MTQKKILVADDEKDIVELVAYNLEREGFAVLRAYDGRRPGRRSTGTSRTSSSST